LMSGMIGSPRSKLWSKSWYCQESDVRIDNNLCSIVGDVNLNNLPGQKILRDMHEKLWRNALLNFKITQAQHETGMMDREQDAPGQLEDIIQRMIN
jgi:hypothetical protein